MSSSQEGFSPSSPQKQTCGSHIRFLIVIAYANRSASFVTPGELVGIAVPEKDFTVRPAEQSDLDSRAEAGVDVR